MRRPDSHGNWQTLAPVQCNVYLLQSLHFTETALVYICKIMVTPIYKEKKRNNVMV